MCRIPSSYKACTWADIWRSYHETTRYQTNCFRVASENANLKIHHQHVIEPRVPSPFSSNMFPHTLWGHSRYTAYSNHFPQNNTPSHPNCKTKTVGPTSSPNMTTPGSLSRKNFITIPFIRTMIWQTHDNRKWRVNLDWWRRAIVYHRGRQYWV